MPAEPNEPTQKTPEGAEREALDLPGEGGMEIPVPSREVIEDALAAIAKSARSVDRKGRPKQQ